MFKKTTVFLGLTLGLTAFFATAGFAFAQLGPPNGFENLGKIDIQTAIRGIIRLLLIVSFVIAFLFLLFGGIRWMLSGGDKTAAEGARGTLTAALIGLVIVLSAWLIITIIETAFGINIINNPIVVPILYK